MISLRPEQEAAVRAMLDAGGGVLVAPCGSGKTTIGLDLIARRGPPALVLVHTGDLARQWADRCAEQLGEVAGVVGAGSDSRGHVTVALMQALIRWAPGEVRALARNLGTILVDECHRVCCDTMATLLGLMPGPARWGLTATPERADGRSPEIHALLGPVVATLGHAGLLAAGRLVPARVEWVRTGRAFDLAALAGAHAEAKVAEARADGRSPRSVAGVRAFFSWKPDEEEMPRWLWSVLYAALAADPERNALVAGIAGRELAAGRTVLVLARLREHCEALAAAVRDAGHAAEALTGARTARRRAALLDAFRAGDLRCVVATSLADEGLDVPRLDRLILASPMRSASATEQRLGRLLRPHPGKAPPVLFDLVDDCGPLRGQARARRKVYGRILGPAASASTPSSASTSSRASTPSPTPRGQADMFAGPGVWRGA